MNKNIPLVFDLSFMTAPVLASGEGAYFLSKKNKASQDEMVEQVDSSDSANW